MQNFKQGPDFDRSVCMAAICYSGPIMAVPTNAAWEEKHECKVSNRFPKI